MRLYDRWNKTEYTGENLIAAPLHARMEKMELKFCITDLFLRRFLVPLMVSQATYLTYFL